MTRINVVPVEELTDKHLGSEWQEITRVYTYAKDRHKNGKTPADLKSPDRYRLNAGHVKWAAKHLGYLNKRYQNLYDELRRRGKKPNKSLMRRVIESSNSLPSCWLNDYTVTPACLAINRQRIEERLSK